MVQVMPHERLLQSTDVLAIEHNTSAPSVTHVTPTEQFSPLPQETVEVVQIGSVHPPGSITVVVPSAFHIVGSLPLLDEVTTHIQHEQMATEQIVHLLVPQIPEQVVEGVKEIPQERLPERIEEQIFDALRSQVDEIR